MKPYQEYSPKYWVVHDKSTTDVFVMTARKDMYSAKNAFMGMYAYERWGRVSHDPVCWDLFEEDERLEVILIELKEVTNI